MSNPFTEFMHSPQGYTIQSCLERIDRSLQGIAESLETIAVKALIRESTLGVAPKEEEKK
jgi:hypothetical protein